MVTNDYGIKLAVQTMHAKYNNDIARITTIVQCNQVNFLKILSVFIVYRIHVKHKNVMEGL